MPTTYEMSVSQANMICDAIADNDALEAFYDALSTAADTADTGADTVLTLQLKGAEEEETEDSETETEEMDI